MSIKNIALLIFYILAWILVIIDTDFLLWMGIFYAIEFVWKKMTNKPFFDVKFKKRMR